MIILDVEQGSPEWFAARCGVISASQLSRIITSKGAKSTQAKTYMNSLIGEMVTGKSEESFSSEWMDRGNEVEGEARDFYSFKTNYDVSEVGFVYKNERRQVGCSPDGLIIKQGKGVEIKCPKASTQVQYLIDQKLPTAYVQQVQTSMYVCGFNEWDFLSYHPDMKPLMITVKKDILFHKKLDQLLYVFIAEMMEKLDKLNSIK